MKPTLTELEERDLVTIALRCAHAHHVSLEDMFSRSRMPPMVAARQDFYRALIEEHGWSSSAVGRLVGRHHTSILIQLGTLARCRQSSDPTEEAAHAKH